MEKINMEKIKVLPQTSSIFNLQKLQISNEILPASSHGKFAIIRTATDSLCLCQIFLSKMLHPSFCNIDMSVCGHQNPTGEKPNVYPVNKPLEFIFLSNLNILPSVKSIKSVTVSVVFTSPFNTKKWKQQKVKLAELVKHILKIFALQSNFVVLLGGLKSSFGVEIHSILIENIGGVSAGRIVSSTKVKINQLISEMTFDQIYTAGEHLPTLGGLEEPMKTLTELVKAAGMFRNKTEKTIFKQVLILGLTGCGKTCLVHQVARDCRAVLKSVMGSELSSPLPGETEQSLTRVFDECRLLAEECPGGCILLLDQVEVLCGRREMGLDGHVLRLSNHFRTLLETVNNTPGLMVVGTSSQPQRIDPAVRRPGRFDHEIHIGVASEKERTRMLQEIARQYKLNVSEVVSSAVARWTPGFVVADLSLLAANVVRRLQKLGIPLNCSDEREMLSCWQHCVCQLQPSALRGQLGVMQVRRGTEDTSPALSQLGGVETVKRSLLQAIQWPLIHPEAFRRLGLPQPKGVLLYGPPGCAKTSLARAVACATHTTFLAVSAAQIYSAYVGEAEKTIAELFHRARQAAPAILFIDEIDALAGSRETREKGAQERILTAFLTEMDGVGVRLDSGTAQTGVVVVAATNRPHVLDPALTRPGRFDRLVYVAPPDPSQRLDILQTITKMMPLAEDVNLPWLAEHTELYSGADLTRLCKEAGLCALMQEGMNAQQISQTHWVSALSSMQPSLSLEQIQKYEDINIFGS